MKIIEKVILIIIITIMIGCSPYRSEQYCKTNELQRAEKMKLIENLIQNPQQFDSILHNSEFYHTKYSIILDENNNFTKKMLSDFKEKNISMNFDDSVYFYEHSKSTFHDFAISYNDKHHFGVYFELMDSIWYLKLIAPMNERIEFKEKNFETIINKLIDAPDSLEHILKKSFFINSDKFSLTKKSKAITDLTKIKMLPKEVEKITYQYEYKYVTDISDTTCCLSMSYYFDIENKDVKKNIITAELYFNNSIWYLKSIEMGSNNTDDYR